MCPWVVNSSEFDREHDPYTMKDVLAAGINCYGIDNLSESGLLVDGCDYYRAFWTAAAKAENYILLSGWQFDSDVQLLRDDGPSAADSTLLPRRNDA